MELALDYFYGLKYEIFDDFSSQMLKKLKKTGY